MNKLLFALGLILWASLGQAQVGPINPILCNLTAQQTLTGTGSTVTTSLVSANAAFRYNICGWHVTESGTTAGTFQLEYGTQGGPCTSPTTLTPGFSVTNTAPSSDHPSYASMSTPTNVQLCVVTTGAGTSTLQILVFYSQT
jgi:hypothetical protein